MRRPPRWARAVLRWLAPREHADDVLGDQIRYRIEKFGLASSGQELPGARGVTSSTAG